MAKIMLVEDDNNLREIYEARLLAEGYEIVSAKDGEEALALAVKEKPDLIISDVMMPKISGFDMLDILRSTPETKETKVIMMTALSQAEDKTRADKLGADRYLVKSQVTLEDVAKVAREVLQGETEGSPAPSTPPSAPEPPEPPDPPPAPNPPAPEPPTGPTNDPPLQASVATPQPALSEPTQAASPAAATTDVPSLAPTKADEEAAVNAQIDDFVAKQQSVEPPKDPAPQATAPAAPVSPEVPLATPPTNIEVQAAPPDATNQAAQNAEQLTSAVNNLLSTPPESSESKSNHTPLSTSLSRDNDNAGDNASNHKRVIQPINDPTIKPDLNALLEKEDQQNTSTPPASSVVSPGGPMVTPPDPNTPPDPTAPGNVIQPGNDPNSIAL
jgi:CheY-like chemotaxis protein